MKWFDDLEVDKNGLYRYKNLSFFFPEHGNYFFALKVREMIHSNKYDAIAIDVEKKWSKKVIEAVNDFPQMSLLVSQKYYIIAEPIEAVLESVRSSLETGADIHFFRASGLENPVQPMERTPDIAHNMSGNALYYNLFLRKGNRSKHSKMLTWYSAGYLNYLNSSYKNVLVLMEPELFRDILCALNHGGEWTDSPVDDDIVLLKEPKSVIHLLSGEFPKLNDYYYFYGKNSSEYLDIYRQVFSDFYSKDKEAKKMACSAPPLLDKALSFSVKSAFFKGLFRPDLFFLVKSLKMFFDDEFALRFLMYAMNLKMNDNINLLNHPYREILNKVMNSSITNYFSYPRKMIKSIQFKISPPKPVKKIWKKKWNENHIVSWPPEDILIENFRSMVFTRSLEMIQLNKSRIEEFRGSLMDGIEFRETLRHLYENKIYVKNIPRIQGKVGAKIIIFDENGDEYSYRSTWYAEHPNESVISFYGKEPKQKIVGPGIGESYYGGIIMIYPPQTFPDIWSDTFFSKLENPMDKLVLAAIIYSEQKYIAYLGKKCFPSHYQAWAEQYKKKLIFLPFSDFSMTTLEKIRKFHVLNGPETRKTAGKYLT